MDEHVRVHVHGRVHEDGRAGDGDGHDDDDDDDGGHDGDGVADVLHGETDVKSSDLHDQGVLGHDYVAEKALLVVVFAAVLDVLPVVDGDDAKNCAVVREFGDHVELPLLRRSHDEQVLLLPVQRGRKLFDRSQ